MTTLRWLTVPSLAPSQETRLHYTGPDKDQQRSEQWALFPVESRRPTGFNIIDDPRPCPPRLLVNLLFECGPKNEGREGKQPQRREGYLRNDRKYYELTTILVLSWNCITEWAIFWILWSRQWRHDVRSLFLNGSIVETRHREGHRFEKSLNVKWTWW